MNELGGRLEAVRERIARAAERAGRDASDVELVAVSKTQPVEAILDAYMLGQRQFGENRVQEARDKRELLAHRQEVGGAVWHLLGHLQSNKVKLAVPLFDIIESLDSVDLARALDARAGVEGKRLGVLLEVDFSGQPQRSGFSPEMVDHAADQISALANLDALGLMTVAPLGLEEADVRSVFRRLRSLRDRLADRFSGDLWRHLSMGMTDDFEIAVEEGATIVRVGRAIFGERPR